MFKIYTKGEKDKSGVDINSLRAFHDDIRKSISKLIKRNPNVEYYIILNKAIQFFLTIPFSYLQSNGISNRFKESMAASVDLFIDSISKEDDLL